MSALAFAAVWLFVFTLPFGNALAIIPGVGLLTKITGGLALAAALGHMVLSGRVRRWHGMHLAGLLFVLWCGTQLFLSPFGQRLPLKYMTYVQLFVMMLIIWELSVSWKRMLSLLTAYVFGSYVAALSTVMLYRREAGQLRRFAAVESDPNSLAMTLALAMPMAWYLGMTSRSALLRWICRAYLIVGFVAVALTASRGGMVATIVALMIVPLTMTKLSPGRLAAAMIVVVVAGAVAVAYVPDRIVQRLATTGTEVEDLTLGGRFQLWTAGVKAFAARPLTGYGTGGWRTAVSPWLGPDPQVAHNSYLSVLVETGLVGLTFYMAMFIAAFLAILRLGSLERRFTLVLLATLGMAMMPLSWDDQKAVWFILAALVGLARGTGTFQRPIPYAPPLRAAPVARAARTGRGRGDPLGAAPDTEPGPAS